MSKMIKSGTAMLRVLKSWGVNHLYGLPGGSINSTMEALFEAQDEIQYIQVRHEETGAIAAAVDAKLTGRIGVCFGSAGPGATHLFNGLYDAQLDKVPVLAIIGQVASTAMNYNSFQEINENPMFTDVSVYNRTVMTPQSLPHIIDEAVRVACKERGVAVVTIPVDYGYVDIVDEGVSSAQACRNTRPLPDPRDVSAAVELIGKAKRPVLYVGQGGRGAREEILAFSEHFSMPVVLSVLAKGIIPDRVEHFMGMAARVATKPANEALAEADLIVFVGSDFPFARFLFPAQAKFIQVDIDPSKFGRRHHVDVAIMGDAKETMRQLVQRGARKPPTQFMEACRKNRQNWCRWLRSFEDDPRMPMRVEPVFKEINRIATDDAIFVADVGNVTTHAIRLLDMNGGKQRFTTSGLFATMGYGVPGGIAAKLSYPQRQVFTLSGDGGFAMAMQDIITQVRYKLSIINIIFSNDSLGFIEAEQEDTNKRNFGVDLTPTDFAKVAIGMGAKGYTVSSRDQLRGIFDEIRNLDGPVVIDVKIANDRPLPVEDLQLDPEKFSPETIAAFTQRYEVRDMPILKDLMRGNDLELLPE